MNEITKEILRRNFLDMKYVRIKEIIAECTQISRENVMAMLYTSPLFELIEDGISVLHCRSDLYLAEEIFLNVTHEI